MAIKQLSPEQVRSMTLEEKDEWWLKNVFRGDMPQPPPGGAHRDDHRGPAVPHQPLRGG